MLICKHTHKDGKETVTVLSCRDGVTMEWNPPYVDMNIVDKIIHSIEINELNGYMPCDGIEHDGDSTYKWYLPKSKLDIDVLNQRYATDLPYSYIGKVVCIEDNRGDCYDYLLDESIEHMNKFINLINLLKEKLNYE